MTTIQALRGLLGEHFAEASTVCRRLTEAQLLPRGRAGVGGSAVIGPRDAATVLLALSSLAWASPIEVAHEARRLAAFTLYSPRTEQPPTLLSVLAGEIRRCADADYEPGAWQVGEFFSTRDFGAERWRFSGPPMPPMPVDERGRPLDILANRFAQIAPGLIAAVGQLFTPLPVETAPAAAASV